MFLPVVACGLNFAGLFSHYCLLYFRILFLPHPYHYTTLITQSPIELYFFMLLCGDIPCSSTPKKHISSSSIFSFWILVHTWRVQRDPLAAAASHTLPEDMTILCSLIENILMTFIENCFGLLYVVTNSITTNDGKWRYTCSPPTIFSLCKMLLFGLE